MTDLLVNSKWKRDGDGYEPDGGDERQTDGWLHARFERVNNDEVAVYGNCSRRQRRHVYADPHRHRNDVIMTYLGVMRRQRPLYYDVVCRIVIGTRWQSASPNGHDCRRPERGVNGTASRHMMTSDTAKLAMKMFVMDCMVRRAATM